MIFPNCRNSVLFGNEFYGTSGQEEIQSPHNWHISICQPTRNNFLSPCLEFFRNSILQFLNPSTFLRRMLCIDSVWPIHSQGSICTDLHTINKKAPILRKLMTCKALMLFHEINNQKRILSNMDAFYWINIYCF
jgi:hypothetical protein